MVKRIFAILIAIVFINSLFVPFTLAYSNSHNNYAARGTYWGMTENQVKTVEHKKIYASTKSFLTYKVKKFGYNAYLYYQFKHNKLTQISYIFNLNKYYYSYSQKKLLYYGLRNKEKNEIHTKGYGLVQDDGSSKLSSSWELKYKDALLMVSDNSEGKTIASLNYIKH
ncbi:MAG: hypothetical protein ABF651_01675 [Sporolactobacillus sp.]